MENYKLGLCSKVVFEEEVISIPASKTFDIIYEHEVYAHPNVEKGYSFKKALYYTFRKTGGFMEKIYVVAKTFMLNPKNPEEIDNLEISDEEKKRVKGYIRDINLRWQFYYDGEYKFYIFSHVEDIKKKPYKLGANSYFYMKYDELINRDGEVKISNNNTIILTDEEYLKLFNDKEEEEDKRSIKNSLLTEKNVISIIQNYLKLKNYKVLDSNVTKNLEIDIAAKNSEINIVIDAIGGSLAYEDKKIGKTLDKNRAMIKLSLGIHNLMRLIQENKNDKTKFALAVPYEDRYIDLVSKIKDSIFNLGIFIIWCNYDGAVAFQNN